MLGLAALAILSFSDCYELAGSPFSSPFIIGPNTCFAFTGANFETDVNVTVKLGVLATNSFFGTDSASGIPLYIAVTHESIPLAGKLDYDLFKASIPIFCNPTVDADYLDNIVVPENSTTDDAHPVHFELRFEANSSAYADHFGQPGHCVLLTRDIPSLDATKVTAAEALALVFGLVGGTVLIAVCVIFLTPVLKRFQPREDDAERPESEDGPELPPEL
jgi:hypothetical protein